MVPTPTPQKICLPSRLRNLLNVTLFGKRVFVDVMKLRISRRDHPGSSLCNLNSVTNILIRETRRGDTERKRERPLVKKEAETGGMQPKAKELLEPPEAGRGKEDSPLELWEGALPGRHLGFRLLT